MQMMEDTKQLFSFSYLEPVTDETNTLPIREVFLLPAPPTTTILEKKDDNSLSFVTSDNYALLLRWSMKICYTPNRYGVVAYY